MNMQFTEPYIGQAAGQRYWQRLRQHGIIAQAHLWIGPKHIGKRTFLVNFLWQWFCQQLDKDQRPCANCFDCRLLASHHHPNVHWVCGETGAISIETIRPIIHEASQTRLHRGPYVIVITAADQLTPSAANALLKLLEEPTEHVYIFLLTAQPEYILPTIQSRCSLMYFRPVRPAELTPLTTDPAAIALAQGLPGLAQRWSLPTERQQLRAEVQQSLDFLLARTVAERSRLFDSVLKKIKTAAQTKHWLSLLQRLCRDVLLLQLGCPTAVLFLSEQTRLWQLAQATTIPQSVAGLTRLARLQQRLVVHLQTKLVFDQLMVTLYHPL